MVPSLTQWGWPCFGSVAITLDHGVGLELCSWRRPVWRLHSGMTATKSLACPALHIFTLTHTLDCCTMACTLAGSQPLCSKGRGTAGPAAIVWHWLHACRASSCCRVSGTWSSQSTLSVSLSIPDTAAPSSQVLLHTATHPKVCLQIRLLGGGCCGYL